MILFQRPHGNHLLIQDDKGNFKFAPQTFFHIVIEQLAKVVTNSTDYKVIKTKNKGQFALRIF